MYHSVSVFISTRAERLSKKTINLITSNLASSSRKSFKFFYSACDCRKSLNVLIAFCGDKSFKSDDGKRKQSKVSADIRTCGCKSNAKWPWMWFLQFVSASEVQATLFHSQCCWSVFMLEVKHLLFKQKAMTYFSIA